MNEIAEHAGWLGQAAFRVRNRWLLTMLVSTAVITAFMAGYFILLRYPQFPVKVMPLTAVDGLVSFQPWAIVPYVTIWLYFSLVPLLLYTRQELQAYLSSVTLVGTIGFAAFLFWPTSVPAPDIDWNLYPSVAFLKSIDATGNACPSLHVAYAVVTGLWLGYLLKEMRAPWSLSALNVAWCLLIVYSALATKQHVSLDMFAGAALGLAVMLPHLYWLGRPQRR